jgi:TonB family protein
MKTHDAQPDPVVKESFVTPLLFSIVVHGVFIGVVIGATWLWGRPTYYKPSAYTVSLVDAPLVLQQPESAGVDSPPPTPQKEAPAAKPTPARVEKPPAPPAATAKALETTLPVAPKKPAPPAAAPKKPETTLPVAPKKPTPPAKQQAETPQQATPAPAASAIEVRSHIERLREQQAQQAAEQERVEKAQRHTAEQHIAALRGQLTSATGAETATDMATGMQRIRLQAYQERVREKIINAWILPMPPEEAHSLQAIALLLVSREGHIEHLAIVQSSGNPLFDASLEHAIRRVAPLPVLPDDYPGERLEVEMRFSPGDS